MDCRFCIGKRFYNVLVKSHDVETGKRIKAGNITSYYSSNLQQYRTISKSTVLMQKYSYQRHIIANHKNYFPNSFVYRRGDHPYGPREYLLVRPHPDFNHNDNIINVDNNNHQVQKQTISSINQQIIPYDKTKNKDDITMLGPLPPNLQLLAVLHANNNIVFGANVNTKVINDHDNQTIPEITPTIIDLCPVLLHAAIDDCSNEGEQPQALSTLYGLSKWICQCLSDPNISMPSEIIRTLQEQMKNPNSSIDGTIKASSNVGRKMVIANARQQLECITAIATNIPRPGHSVVGQKTHTDGATGWEAIAREYALLDYTYDTDKNVYEEYDNDENDTTTKSPTNHTDPSTTIIKTTATSTNNKDNIQLSDECLLYRNYSEQCTLVEIVLLADTSPSYLLSAGGAMARFFIM
jgi:hypothetical protein